MPALQFTRDLADAIRAGRKSQTLRAKLPPGCVVGARLTLMNGYHAHALVGHAVIVSVDQVAQTVLAIEDALLDGFDSLASLHTRLDAMGAPSTLWRIRWRDFSQAPAVSSPASDPSPARRTRTPRRGARRRPLRRAP